MRSIRIPVLLCLMVVVTGLLFLGGCSPHYVDVYINKDCNLVTLAQGGVINPLWVYPGDYVIFNNMTNDVAEITLPEGMFEGERNFEIKAFGKVTKKVIQKDMTIDKQIDIDCTGGSGSPKVSVGDDP